MEAGQRQLANDRGRNRPFQKLGASRLGKAAKARADSIEERACDCSAAASRSAPLAAARPTLIFISLGEASRTALAQPASSLSEISLTKLLVLQNLLFKRQALVGGHFGGEFGAGTIPATDPF
jgi:hypothetical protein